MLPFRRFRTADGRVVDSLLGPEMRSTGEVMGIDRDFPTAFAKSQSAAYGGLPTSGTVVVSDSGDFECEQHPSLLSHAQAHRSA